MQDGAAAARRAPRCMHYATSFVLIAPFSALVLVPARMPADMVRALLLQAMVAAAAPCQWMLPLAPVAAAVAARTWLPAMLVVAAAQACMAWAPAAAWATPEAWVAAAAVTLQ